MFRCPAALLLVALAPASYATETDRHQNQVETISVTASRTPVRTVDLGSSLTIIDREQIELRGASSLADLLRGVPGLAVSRQGAVGSLTQVRVRGAEANQVMVLIDGIEANDLAQGGEFNFAHMPIHHVERVEIVRGPQSAIWGSDAMAGVINVITRPSRMGAGASAFVEGGSFGSQRVSGLVEGSAGSTEARLTLDLEETDGTNVSRLGDEEDGYRNVTVNLVGRTSLTPNAEILYSLRNTDARTEFDGIDFVTTGLPVDADRVTDNHQTMYNVGLRVSGEALNHKVSFARVSTDTVTDTGATVDDKASGTREQLSYQLDYFAGNHTLSALAEYEQEDYRQRGSASFFGDPNRNLDASAKHIALEYRFNGERFDTSVSARQVDNSAFGDALTWRATLAWHVGSATIFSSLGESVKNPTFVERFGFFDTFTGNPDLDPEKSKSVEFGYRQRFLEDRLSVSGTWYLATLDDEINGFVFDPASGGFTARNVAGESNRQGLELEADYRINENLSVAMSYSWLDATQEDGSGNDVVEVRRPDNSGTVSLSWTGSKFRLHTGVTWTDSQQDDWFPPFPPFQQRVNLDSYTLASMTGTYVMSDKVEFTLRAENVLDEDYEEVYGFASPGASVYGGIRIRF